MGWQLIRFKHMFFPSRQSAIHLASGSVWNPAGTSFYVFFGRLIPVELQYAVDRQCVHWIVCLKRCMVLIHIALALTGEAAGGC